MASKRWVYSVPGIIISILVILIIYWIPSPPRVDANKLTEWRAFCGKAIEKAACDTLDFDGDGKPDCKWEYGKCQPNLEPILKELETGVPRLFQVTLALMILTSFAFISIALMAVPYYKEFKKKGMAKEAKIILLVILFCLILAFVMVLGLLGMVSG